MVSRWMVVSVPAVALALACDSPPSRPQPRGLPDLVITTPQQRDALVGRQVTVVGVQTRTKVPTVCGVDVDGAYELSDQIVIVNGVLRRHVVTEADPTTANRGPGTFYDIVDPVTHRLATTAARP
jgi:hypothetical protein